MLRRRVASLHQDKVAPLLRLAENALDEVRAEQRVEAGQCKAEHRRFTLFLHDDGAFSLCAADIAVISQQRQGVAGCDAADAVLRGKRRLGGQQRAAAPLPRQNLLDQLLIDYLIDRSFFHRRASGEQDRFDLKRCKVQPDTAVFERQLRRRTFHQVRFRRRSHREAE